MSEAAAGVHYWNVMEDRVYSDEAAAELFGFTVEEGLRGLPLQSYTERMHPEDLPRVARAIHDAMLSGSSYHEEYRVIRPDMSIANVCAIGRWFRDGDGEPHHYSGILFAKPVEAVVPLSIRQLCLIAHDMAKAEGHVEAADKIIEALHCLEIGTQVASLQQLTCH